MTEVDLSAFKAEIAEMSEQLDEAKMVVSNNNLVIMEAMGQLSTDLSKAYTLIVDLIERQGRLERKLEKLENDRTRARKLF